MRSIRLSANVITDEIINVASSDVATSYANLIKIDFVKFDTIEDIASDIRRISKLKKVSVLNVKKSLSNLRDLHTDAAAEYLEYHRLFKEYLKVWQSFGIDGLDTVTNEKTNEFASTYELRNKILEKFYRSTTLSKYNAIAERFFDVKRQLENLQDKQENLLTIYI